MDEIPIRRAEPRDAAEIARLTTLLGYPVESAVLERRLFRLLGSAADVVFVAGTDRLHGWIHGFVSQLLESDCRVEIGGLVVDPASRRRGIGGRLVGSVEAWARGQGVTGLSVRCRVERPEAHRLYEGLGFACAKTQKVFRKPLGV